VSGSNTGLVPECVFSFDLSKLITFLSQILRQAKDNQTPIRAFGGTFPLSPMPDDVVVDLRYIDRLVGLDIYQQT
jgi:hypothetical protein